MSDHSEVLFSVNRSMWGMVTPSLRAVSYLLSDTRLLVRFSYADEPDAWTLEAVNIAEGECIADMWQTHEVSYIAEHVPMPEPLVLEKDGRYVFVRYEGDDLE